MNTFILRAAVAACAMVVCLCVPAWAFAVEIGADDFRISHSGPDGDANFDATKPAVAYNSTDNQYLVVWIGETSTDNEFEVYGRIVDATTGDLLGTDDIRISDMGPNGNTSFRARTPSVAYDSVDNQYLVVWTGDDDTGTLVDGEDEIFGQRLDASGAEVGTNDFRISDMGPDGDPNYDADFPDVAYDSADDQYLVVWKADDNVGGVVDGEYEIYGQRLNAATGAAVGTNDFRISDMGPNGNVLYGAIVPAVAYNSVDNEYLVVWEGDDNSGSLVDDEFEIFGQRYNAATGVSAGSNDFRISHMGTDGDPTFVAFDPDVVYNPNEDEYLVVWYGTNDVAGLANDEDEIYGQRLDKTGTLVGATGFRISDMGPDGNGLFGAFFPSVAFDTAADAYLVTWEGNDGPPLDDLEREIYGQLLDASGAEIGTNDFRISQMGPDGSSSFIGDYPAVAYASVPGEYLVTWEGDDDTSPLVDDEFEIFGQRLSLLRCGNGAVEPGEACDDGNVVDGDGCDASCQTESSATTGGTTTGGTTSGGTGGTAGTSGGTSGSSGSGGGCSLVSFTSVSEHRAAGSGLIR